ncbi:hypothetical protein [Asaia sp. As-1742]|uniref:hypothetical protein n=1 Tax=Asaia sp. As-1742 TaxID=2608325 RepID=UPI0014212127|nr:hypothetical protein [Asaia sp. As-1742]NIE81160.1 hypothetical protein [Asaia sp. As-1742]
MAGAPIDHQTDETTGRIGGGEKREASYGSGSGDDELNALPGRAMVLDEDDSMIDIALALDIGCYRVFVATSGFTLIVKCGVAGPVSSLMLQTPWTEFEELAVTCCEHTGIE